MSLPPPVRVTLRRLSPVLRGLTSVIVSSAPFSSAPFAAAFLLNGTVMMSSVMSTFSTSLSPIVILPSSTVKMISVVTLNPLGAASSWRVYVPSSGYTSVALVPLIQTRLSPAEFTTFASVPATIESAAKLTGVVPSFLTPVRVRVAPFISVPPSADLLIGTAIFSLGLSVTCILFVPSAAIDEPPVVTAVESVIIPPLTVNSNLVSTFSKPSGATVSSRVYLPSGRFVIFLEVSPDVQLTDFLSAERSSGLISVFVRSVTEPVASTSVSVISAPASSSEPPTSFLLISITASSNIVVSPVTLPLSSIVNVTDSSFFS